MGVLEQLGKGGPVALWSHATIKDPERKLRILRITRRRDLHVTARSSHALRLDSHAAPLDGAGFGALISNELHTAPVADVPVIELPETLAYLDEGDVIRIDARRGRIDTLYRRGSKHNTLLLTDRCNSYCVMCSQPPKAEDDSHLVNELLHAIPLFHPDTDELGFTGGEPTLLGHDLLRLIACARDWLPSTKLHILSNGRNFKRFDFARSVADVGHPNLVLGIPLYSDVASSHDFVVQRDGAFVETIAGLRNLGRLKIHVELRVVVHKFTYQRLPELARFITRNLTFVDQVSVMGLETIGFAKSNIDAIWIDPADCQVQLREAVELLDVARIPVAIFNHQLCVLDRKLWPFAVQSISDWKNIYLPECAGCIVQTSCAGFFASNILRHSSRIRAFA